MGLMNPESWDEGQDGWNEGLDARERYKLPNKVEGETWREDVAAGDRAAKECHARLKARAYGLHDVGSEEND